MAENLAEESADRYRDLVEGVDAFVWEATVDPWQDTSSKFGLFTIRERMRALGGRFEVQSAQSKGTTATLILPLAASTESTAVNDVSGEQPTIPSSYNRWRA
jgi:hypothetical protein